MIDQQEDVIHRLDRIEQMLRDLLEKETLKEWYCRFYLATFVPLWLETNGVMVRHLIMES